MPYTHSFEHTTPPARFDNVPWTRVLVEQRPLDLSTDWALIDEQAIAIDATPATPDPVALTVTAATLERAFFRFRFDVASSNPSPPSPAVVSPPPDYRPTVEQVAAILRARTRGPASRDATIAGEQGTFTTTTRPTRTQVEENIDTAVGELTGMFAGRTPCTPPLEQSAAAAAGYRAAQLVEVSYKPEQTSGDTTAFKALEQLWTDAAKTIAAAVIAQCPVTPGGGLSGDPLGRGPLYEPIGWHTRW